MTRLSKSKLQSHLYAAGIVSLRLRVKPAKGGRRWIDHNLIGVEQGMVKGIDELRPELQILAFADLGSLDDGKIRVVDIVTPEVTEPQWERSDLAGGSLLICSFDKSRVGIEPTLNRSLARREDDVFEVTVEDDP